MRGTTAQRPEAWPTHSREEFHCLHNDDDGGGGGVRDDDDDDDDDEDDGNGMEKEVDQQGRVPLPS